MSNFAANQIYRIMYSSEDLERFYFQYQTEALPHGESLQSFCLKNKVPYNIFQKWFKDTRKKVVEVQVDGAPEIAHEEKTKTGDRPKPESKSSNDNPVRIWIDIRISNGLHLSQKNLSYQDLVRMIPCDGDVFIVMSRNRRIVRMFSFDNHSYSLFEKKFVAGYQFMKVERNGADTVYRIDWKDVVLILENPIVKTLKIR